MNKVLLITIVVVVMFGIYFIANLFFNKVISGKVSLDYNDKTKEIARLQSGEVITKISLDGAAELIRAADAFKQNLK